MAARLNLDGKAIKPLTICLIGGGGFIGSHLCEKLMKETSHTALVLDVTFKKCNHLARNLSLWRGRLKFHKPTAFNRIEELIQGSDLVVNIAGFTSPADYDTSPSDGIFSNFVDGISVARICIENHKRLIHLSGSEVYGKTIASILPIDHPLKQDPDFNILKEDVSPCIFGAVKEYGWSYACAKQFVERFIYAAFTEQGLEFTIVRNFNWIGSRMDIRPSYDGEGIPKVLDCFLKNLRCAGSLKLVDGMQIMHDVFDSLLLDMGEFRTTFCHIKDAIDAVSLMIDNPKRANGHIFNVGNPANEVTMKELAEMMIEVYVQVYSDSSSSVITTDESSEFYELGDDDCDRLIPDITIVNRQLGWSPTMPLNDLLQVTLKDQHEVYTELMEQQASDIAEAFAALKSR